MDLSGWDDLTDAEQRYVRQRFDDAAGFDLLYGPHGKNSELYKKTVALNRALGEYIDAVRDGPSPLALETDWTVDPSTGVWSGSGNSLKALHEAVQLYLEYFEPTGRPTEHRFHAAVKALSDVWEKHGGDLGPGASPGNGVRPNALMRFLTDCLKELAPTELRSDQTAMAKALNALRSVKKSARPRGA